MLLVTSDQIADLRRLLGSGTGFRVASIDITGDPFDFARTGAALVDRAVAFSSPDGVRVAGLGTAWRTEATGPERFGRIQQALSTLADRPLRSFVGFSFLDDPHRDSPWDGFAAAEAFIPRVSIEGSDAGARITVVIPPGEEPDPTLDLLATVQKPKWRTMVETGDHATESHPPASVWKERVGAALKSIEVGEIEKAVLARSVLVRSSEPPPILMMFRSLVRDYPECFNFAWKSHDAVFMGASPELLASVRGRRFRSNPLAGSARRGEGSEEDERIGAALLASDKDRKEHEFVVDAIRTSLREVATDISFSPEPELKKMASVQHLSSFVDATMRDGRGLLDAVAAIHPTPAVAGTPTSEAIDLIEDIEQIDRGWYTGGVGWVDTEGNGSIALALRCGLIRGLSTRLYAGAGIVAGSDPDAEVEETRLKLLPLLRLLTAT